MDNSLKTMLRLSFYTSVFLLITVLHLTVTTAQDWQSEVDRINLDRQQSLGRMEDQARTESLVAEQAETLGLLKIRSGKASTKFTPTPGGYAYTIGFLKFDPDEPQTKSGQIKRVQEWVKDFEARMVRAGGFALNDNVDAANFACILSYEAYHGKKPTGEHLRYFQQMRIDDRKKVLGAAYYQGFGDERKQKMYILDAMMSIQAIEWREKARAAKTGAERQAAEEKAKQYANYKLKLNLNQ